MAAIVSPCTRLCAMDPVTRLCAGCGRTLDEIANWLNYDNNRRRRIMAALAERMATMNAPWKKRLWNAWNRRKRLCFSTITATIEKMRPMQQGA